MMMPRMMIMIGQQREKEGETRVGRIAQSTNNDEEIGDTFHTTYSRDVARIQFLIAKVFIVRIEHKLARSVAEPP